MYIISATIISSFKAACKLGVKFLCSVKQAHSARFTCCKHAVDLQRASNLFLIVEGGGGDHLLWLFSV